MSYSPREIVLSVNQTLHTAQDLINGHFNELKRKVELRREDLIKKIGLVYDLKTEEIKKQVPIVVEEDTRQINRKGSGNNSNLSFHKYTTNNPHGVFETLNGDLSFSQSRNGKILLN